MLFMLTSTLSINIDGIICLHTCSPISCCQPESFGVPQRPLCAVDAKHHGMDQHPASIP
ncbi:hypothetical protein ID866_10597 [Astraeus odoratus]|nr:hypothetical protein ID866_10597 [Astraeus odoratus]